MELKTENNILLETLIEHNNKIVISSFCSSFEIEVDEANLIFSDLMRFFWISNCFNDEDLTVIDKPILVIDEMWHTYILHTKEYFSFCDSFFGRYIHHTPVAKGTNLNKSYDENVREKRRRYEKIYDIFGDEIFKRWFIQYPDKFSAKNLRHLKK